MSWILAVTVEKCDVDAAIFIGVLKVDCVSFVEEIGIKDDRAVLAIRNRNWFSAALF